MQSVKWGEFRITDIFIVKNTHNILSTETVAGSGKIPYLCASSENNAVSSYISFDEDFLENGNCIFIGGKTFVVSYQENDFFSNDSHNLVLYLKNTERRTKYTQLYMASCIEKSLGHKYTWGNSISHKKIEDEYVVLPVNLNGEIDFDFMEAFVRELEEERVRELEEERVRELEEERVRELEEERVRELEEERVRELEEERVRELEEERVRELAAYLTVSGLADYKLSASEEASLLRFETLEWQEFRVGDLFSRVGTKKLPYKANDLPKQPTDGYTLPCLTSSFNNQGLNYFVPREGATVLKDCISIPSNSDVYRAYYQSGEFTVLSDAYAIKWKSDVTRLTPKQYLFTVPCINKVTDLPIYSYKNKLGGWNVVQDKKILLPVKDGIPDFASMESFIGAVQKLVIKDVVQYSDRKISATKDVVKRSDDAESL